MNSEIHILVVEDEKNHADVLAEVLERAGYVVEVATSFEEGRRRLEGGGQHIVVTDLDLGDHRGTEFLDLARELNPTPDVMLISGVGSIEDAVQSMQWGAQHYFTKPLDVEEIRSVIGRSAERIKARRSALAPIDSSAQAVPGFEGIIGRSAPMLRVYELVERLAPSSATLLVLGENGTGKELVAKAIHALSDRHDRPFVAINCAALNEGLLESELFGHERGAFTGAQSAREGKFEFANGGTLFLDEVGDMPLSLQVKLLRVLQEREVVRLGSNKTIKVDVRLVCATNKDLEKEIQEGRFREDLYYRIKVVSIPMPALRDRRDDIPLLVEGFLHEFARLHNRSASRVAPEVMQLLVTQTWPGNVRQLRNTIEAMVLLSRGDILTKDDLPPDIQSAPPPTSTALISMGDFANYTLDQIEKLLISVQLERNEGNRAKVATALGISERTLYRKLKEYGLS